MKEQEYVNFRIVPTEQESCFTADFLTESADGEGIVIITARKWRRLVELARIGIEHEEPQ